MRCLNCRGKFVPSKFQRWALKKNPNRKTFCSPLCYHKSKRGSGNPNWKGGRTISKGYVYIYKPDHPFAEHHGYVLEHRLVMEKKLKRLLRSSESVHHEDRNKAHNEERNLDLFEKEGKHRKYHVQFRKRNQKGQFERS